MERTGQGPANQVTNLQGIERDTCPLSGHPRLGQIQWLDNPIYVQQPSFSSIPGSLTRSLTPVLCFDMPELQVGGRLINYALYYLCDVPEFPNSTPWLDNIRVGVIHPAQSSVVPGPGWMGGAGIARLSPNPWDGAG